MRLYTTRVDDGHHIIKVEEHDSHNIIVAGTNEADMQVAVAAIGSHQGGVCVVGYDFFHALVGARKTEDLGDFGF